MGNLPAGHEFPEDDHGVTIDVIERLAPILGRLVIGYSFVDQAAMHCYLKLPADLRREARDPKKVPFDDRLDALKIAAKSGRLHERYRDRLLEAVRFAKQHAAIRHIACHWTLSQYVEAKGGRCHFVRAAADHEGKVDMDGRWLYMSELLKAYTDGQHAADLFYDVLLEDENVSPGH